MESAASVTDKDAERLTCFEVRGLFGQLNLRIAVSRGGRVTAIIAPNGSGKTLCLRLLNALFRKRWSVFADSQFDKIRFVFSSGNEVAIVQDKLPGDTDEAVPKRSIRITL